MITIATLLWKANSHSQAFSKAYDEAWVEKLYRGAARNLTQPFRFVCYVDRERAFSEPIEQVQIAAEVPTYGSCIQPFEMNEPMILMGLDTVITGNIDHLAAYCLTAPDMALPRDPYHPDMVCNGVCLVPAGCREVWDSYRGGNDMEHIRQFRAECIDDMFPWHVLSYKAHVKPRGMGVGDARIIYFHGEEKPPELRGEPWIADHWR